MGHHFLERQPSTGEKFGKAFANLGQSAAQLIPQHFIQENQKKEMISFADKLQKNNPKSPLHRTIADIYRSGLPMDQKSEMVKALTGIDPFKMDQQKRLEIESTRKLYNDKIKEKQNALKDYVPAAKRAVLEQELKDLQAERDRALGFEVLQEEELEEENPTKKVKFNNKNKEHKAKAEQLFKKYNDKEKVREILSKEFEF